MKIVTEPKKIDEILNRGTIVEILPTRNEFRKSFVVQKGKLHELPEGFYLIAPTRIRPFLFSPIFSFPAKLRMAAELILPKKDGLDDESIGSFIRRRFGKECLDRAGQALLEHL